MLTYDFKHKEEQIEKFCSLLEELIITVALGTEGRLLWTNKILKKWKKIIGRMNRCVKLRKKF